MRTWASVFTLGIVLFIYSCTTKVDLVQEGLEKSVVYGFIDPTVDTQFVKITKTFATEGNAFDSAQDPSLSEYQNLEAYIVVYDGSDSVNAYLLQEKIVTDKDSGAFYYPVQTVYYTDEIVFGANNDPQYDYDFEVQFSASGNDVSSKVAVVGAFEPNNTQSFPNISLVAIFNESGSSYQDYGMIVTQSKNTRRYEFTLRYHYIEEYINGTQKAKYMDFAYSEWITNGLSGNEDHSFIINGESFFSGVGTRLASQDNEDNVSRRIIGKIDYIFDYAGDDFNTFIELSEPSTSFNSELNPYTNITNGLGVWGSRGQAVFVDKKLEAKSIQEMALGQYTIDYKFCSDDPGHVGLSYGCN
jgi:hypothetical protein